MNYELIVKITLALMALGAVIGVLTNYIHLRRLRNIYAGKGDTVHRYATTERPAPPPLPAARDVTGRPVPDDIYSNPFHPLNPVSPFSHVTDYSSIGSSCDSSSSSSSDSGSCGSGGEMSKDIDDLRRLMLARIDKGTALHSDRAMLDVLNQRDRLLAAAKAVCATDLDFTMSGLKYYVEPLEQLQAAIAACEVQS